MILLKCIQEITLNITGKNCWNNIGIDIISRSQHDCMTTCWAFYGMYGVILQCWDISRIKWNRRWRMMPYGADPLAFDILWCTLIMPCTSLLCYDVGCDVISICLDFSLFSFIVWWWYIPASCCELFSILEKMCHNKWIPCISFGIWWVSYS